MKNINITLFAIACSMTSLAQAQTAGERLQRVVVSYSLSTELVTTQSIQRHSNEHCLTLDTGTAWCVPVAGKVSAANVIRQKQLINTVLSSQAVSVPAELTITQAIE